MPVHNLFDKDLSGISISWVELVQHMSFSAGFSCSDDTQHPPTINTHIHCVCVRERERESEREERKQSNLVCSGRVLLLWQLQPNVRLCSC